MISYTVNQDLDNKGLFCSKNKNNSKDNMIHHSLSKITMAVDQSNLFVGSQFIVNKYNRPFNPRHIHLPNCNYLTKAKVVT